MCYSAEVSFLTWGFGMMSALVLWSQGQPLKSFLFPLVIAQMQLVEGLRWINAMDERILAVLGKLVIYAQPVAGMIELGKPSWVLPYILIQGLLELLAGSRTLSFAVAEDGHLRWDWLDEVSITSVPYWVALFAVTYMLYPTGVGLFFLGLLFYYGVNHWQYDTWGSLWCVSVNLLWIYYLLKR